MLTISADPEHLGARIDATAALHTWGSAMAHRPHIHMIVPAGGISLDGTRWVHCRANFLMPVPALSCLFRRLFLTRLADAYGARRLAFFEEIEGLGRPLPNPRQSSPISLANTHRVAVSNSRLLSLNERAVRFRYKDYRHHGRARFRTMTLMASEFIRRFPLHVLPNGFHRIRHYGSSPMPTGPTTLH